MTCNEIVNYLVEDYSDYLNYGVEMSYSDGEIKFKGALWEVTMDVDDDYFSLSIEGDCGIDANELDLIHHIKDMREEIVEMLCEED